jgi:transcriptional regulator with XRE-family HTH domain
MANSPENKSLGEVIHDARVALDWSLRDLAKRLDKTPSYLSDIENDRRVPAEGMLVDLAKLLKLDFNDLMARGGRFGDDAVRYMMRTPAAGVLFRKLAERNAAPDAVEKLIKEADRLPAKKKE